jgi:hypothetical protein
MSNLTLDDWAKTIDTPEAAARRCDDMAHDLREFCKLWGWDRKMWRLYSRLQKRATELRQ